MASIVGGEVDNSWGVAGVGYAGVSIMPVTVLDASGQGLDSDIIAGVAYAADHGADVILMAFSNPGYSPALQAAIDYAWAAGAVLVAATGNDGVPADTYPAGDRGVIGVAATDQTDALAGFSNYGAAAFMAAPGVDIQASAQATTAPRSPAPPQLQPTSPAPRLCSPPSILLPAMARSSAASPATRTRSPIRPRPATAASTWPAPQETR